MLIKNFEDFKIIEAKQYVVPDEIDSPEEDYLYVEKSQIPNAGKGLFTAIDIEKNEIIAVFKGEILDEDEEEKRKDKNEYFVVLLNGLVMDSKYTDCFAKYANDAECKFKTKFKNNAIITINFENEPCLVATKKIKDGEEIFVSYGSDYWSDK